MTPLAMRFIEDESGTTAIEYALIGVGISVAILVAVQSLGANVTALFESAAGIFAGT